MTDTDRTQGQQDTKDVAREEAGRVGESARQEMGRVADEARTQGKQLYEEARSKAKEEARHQTDRAAVGLRTVSSDLRTLAENEHTETPLASWMQQGADRLEDLATHVGDRGFDGLMEDVKGFARRNPGTFLGISFGVGLLAGRLVRNVDMDSKGGAATAPPYSTSPTQRGVERPTPEGGGPRLSQPAPSTRRPGGGE